MDLLELDEFAQKIIRQAADKIRKSFCYDLQIETKSNANDLVTNIDRETELFFIQKIQSNYPTHRILGEEGMGKNVESAEWAHWNMCRQVRISGI